jgi:hypothetical protein
MRNQNSRIKNFKIRDFKVQMYDRNIIAAIFLLLLISLCVTLYLNNNNSELTIPDPVFAQVKGGLSASSVNPNSTVGERTGNSTGDQMTGGTSAASVTDGLAMTMSPSSESTGNTTNLTSTEGGLSASSVNKAEKG